MRYQGTDCALMCSAPSVEAFLEAFLKQYKKEFGFTMPNRAVLIDDVRVRGVGCTQFGREASLAEASNGYTVKQRLREEIESPFRKVRLAFFAFSSASAFVAFYFILIH